MTSFLHQNEAQLPILAQCTTQGLVNKRVASLKPDPIDKSIVPFHCYFRTLQPVKFELNISSGTISHYSNVCLVGTNIEGFHHVFQEL